MKLNNLFIKSVCLIVAFSMLVFSQPLLTDASAVYNYKNEDHKCGLYDGTNDMPAEHLAAGMEIALEMRDMPEINIVPIGHSVPTGIFSGWNWNSAITEFDLAENTKFSNACAPAIMAWDWVSRISGHPSSLGGVAAADLHVLVVQLTWAPFMGPTDEQKNTPLSQLIDKFKEELYTLVQEAKESFPNLKMILLEADPWQNNHEPYHAYHEWFINRQVMLDQINGVADVSYTGSNPKTAWICMGGCFWNPDDVNHQEYYTDNCHISGTGATHFRKEWINNLLEMNPVVKAWLSADEPVENIFKPVVPKLAVNFLELDRGIEVTFSLFSPTKISLGLFSAKGQAIVPMFEKTYATGKNSVLLKTDNQLTPGTYIVRFNDGTTTKSRMTKVTQ